MPHKDRDARNAYMRARAARIKAENPEKAEADRLKALEATKKWQHANKEKSAAIFKKWYYEQGGKERQRETHGYKPWDEYKAEVEAQRKERAAYMKDWSQTEKGKRNRVAQSVKKRCGITIDEYDKAYDAQEGKCKICNRPGPRYDADRLVVDHCHTRGHFRALLCAPCNSAIGLFREDVSIMKNAIAYIESVT